MKGGGVGGVDVEGAESEGQKRGAESEGENERCKERLKPDAPPVKTIFYSKVYMPSRREQIFCDGSRLDYLRSKFKKVVNMAHPIPNMFKYFPLTQRGFSVKHIAAHFFVLAGSPISLSSDLLLYANQSPWWGQPKLVRPGTALFWSLVGFEISVNQHA